MLSTQRAVGIFPNYEAAEAALIELRNRDFPMTQVSVVAQDIDHHPDMIGANTSDRMETVGNLHTQDNDSHDGAKTGAVTGSTLGGITGLLVGLGAIAIPGVGPVMLAGATATAIATTLSGTVIGAAAGSLAGGLIGLGLPADRADTYSDRVSKGHYLVMVESGAIGLSLAHDVLHEHKIHDWYIYDLPNDVPSHPPSPRPPAAQRPM